MGKYGDAALRATKLLQDRKSDSPNGAWWVAVSEIFPDSPSAQNKGCPRGAYLGLCESGLIVGIPEGKYCNSKKNKGYALKAVALLKQSTSRTHDTATLWQLVMEGENKTPNHQMDVVLSLWEQGCIR